MGGEVIGQSRGLKRSSVDGYDGAAGTHFWMMEGGEQPGAANSDCWAGTIW